MIFTGCEFGDSFPSGNTNFWSGSGPNCQYFEGKEQIESREPRGGAGDDTAPFNLRPLHITIPKHPQRKLNVLFTHFSIQRSHLSLPWPLRYRPHRAPSSPLPHSSLLPLHSSPLPLSSAAPASPLPPAGPPQSAPAPSAG